MRPLQDEEWQLVEAAFKYRIRAWQKDVIQRLFAGRDVMLIAPTGAGKSGLFRLATLAWPCLLWVIVVPLKDLEREQKEKLGEGAVYINSENRSKKVFDQVRTGAFNAVLVSPEMALSNDFLGLFEHDSFRSRLAGFMFDEAHTLVDWGDTFRTRMKEMGLLRLQVSLTCSTWGSNRPNLCIKICQMQHPTGTYLDLLAFLPELWPSASDSSATRPAPVPTLIYLSDKSEIQNMWRSMRTWYENAGLAGKITTFTADSSDSHKELLRELIERGEILCVLATDALGMGADIAAILRVIQWGIGKETSPAAILQHLGRACRRSGDAATGIVLVEPWVTGTGLRDAKQRDKVNADLLDIVDSALRGQGCIRYRFNALMQNPVTPLYSSEALFGAGPGTFDAMPCCGSCIGFQSPKTLPQSKAIAAEVRAKLLAWRVEQANGRYRHHVGRDPLGLAALLRDEDIADITSNITKVVHGLRSADEPAWSMHRFVRSRLSGTILPEICGVIETVLRDLEVEQAAEAQKRIDEAELRAQQRDEAENARFLQKCRDKRERMLEGKVPLRQCEVCRDWLAKKPNWNADNPSLQVEPYGHYRIRAKNILGHMTRGAEDLGICPI
ncbi:hypothetical protein V8E36_002812 [Tilletia maclaganii]